MKILLKIISYAGLGLTLIPSILVFKGVIELRMHFLLMIAGLVLWFATAPFWMESHSLEEPE
jgi:hypothetical protein